MHVSLPLWMMWLKGCTTQRSHDAGPHVSWGATPGCGGPRRTARSAWGSLVGNAPSRFMWKMTLTILTTLTTLALNLSRMEPVQAGPRACWPLNIARSALRPSKGLSRTPFNNLYRTAVSVTHFLGKTSVTSLKRVKDRSAVQAGKSIGLL